MTTAPPREAAPRLLLGPILRYVDETEATLWVETDRPATVEIGGHSVQTWTVHDHHYALVVLTDLPRASAVPYQVHLDGRQVWPEPDSPFPPSVIRTLDDDGEVRLAFGSCRRDAPSDAAGLRQFGADALVGLAHRMSTGEIDRWPDALLMVGDQVYADEPSQALQERLAARHRQVQGDDVRTEVRDFEEYTWLYHATWAVPAVRWLLSTVPTAMLLDDHDLRDDWNTSLAWRAEMAQRPWWRDRVVGAFASYWVYQHLGNLSPRELAADELFSAFTATGDDQLTDADRSAMLDDFAWRSDTEPQAGRWSYFRDLRSSDGCRVRMVAIDSRCSRVLDPDDRAMLDDAEWEWVREHAKAPVDHLLLATTLPAFMLHTLHDVEVWNDTMARRARSPRMRERMEALRQAVDLEHWPAFGRSFADLVDLLRDTATAPDAPASVLVLSGDVHCSYTAQVDVGDAPGTSAVHQLVMSPFRNPLHQALRVANRLAERSVVRRLSRWITRRSGIADPPVDWTVDQGPWFHNGVMTLVLRGREAELEIDHAEVRRGAQRLRRTAVVPLTPRPGALTRR